MTKRQATIPSFSLIKTLSLSILGLITTFTSQVLAQNVSNQKSSLESTILQEINKARTNPIAYADWLESNTSSTTSLTSQTNQAINFLRNLQPLPAIQTSSELVKVASEASQNNSANTSVNNSYGLINIPIANNSQAKQVVISLLNNQTKQADIFSSATDKTGIACNSSVKNCVMAYPQKAQVAVRDSRANRGSVFGIIDNSTLLTPRQSTLPSSSLPIPISIPESNTNNDNNNNNNQAESVEQSPSSPTQDNPQTVAATQDYNLLERGTLEEGDLVIPSDGSLYDAFVWQGKKGDSLVVTLESKDFDTYLAVQDSTGNIIAENDDLREGNSNSSLSVVLPKDGTYRFIINSYDPKGRGDYTISVERK